MHAQTMAPLPESPVLEHHVRAYYRLQYQVRNHVLLYRLGRTYFAAGPSAWTLERHAQVVWDRRASSDLAMIPAAALAAALVRLVHAGHRCAVADYAPEYAGAVITRSVRGGTVA